VGPPAFDNASFAVYDLARRPDRSEDRAATQR
jgi:hypothetical protein